MNEPEPVIQDAAPSSAADATSNGAPAVAEPPVAHIAPPSAEPILVAPPTEPMIETVARMSSVAAPLPPAEPAPSPTRPQEVEALEDRLRRLESLLSNLADSKQMEDRLAERLSKRVEQAAPVASIAAAPTATVVPPTADAPGPMPQAATWLGAGRRWLPLGLGWRTRVEKEKDGRANLHPSWLLFDVLREAQSILHMYGDPRYRLTWSGRVFPLLFLVAIFTSALWTYPLLWWIPWETMKGLIIKAIDLVPAFFLFKVLSREARRYRETVQPYPHAPHQ